MMTLMDIAAFVVYVVATAVTIFALYVSLKLFRVKVKGRLQHGAVVALSLITLVTSYILSMFYIPLVLAALAILVVGLKFALRMSVVKALGVSALWAVIVAAAVPVATYVIYV